MCHSLRALGFLQTATPKNRSAVIKSEPHYLVYFRTTWRLRWARSERYGPLFHFLHPLLGFREGNLYNWNKYLIDLFSVCLLITYSLLRMVYSSRNWMKFWLESLLRMVTPASRLESLPCALRSSSEPLVHRMFLVIFYFYFILYISSVKIANNNKNNNDNNNNN